MEVTAILMSLVLQLSQMQKRKFVRFLINYFIAHFLTFIEHTNFFSIWVASNLDIDLYDDGILEENLENFEEEILSERIDESVDNEIKSESPNIRKNFLETFIWDLIQYVSCLIPFK